MDIKYPPFYNAICKTQIKYFEFPVIISVTSLTIAPTVHMNSEHCVDNIYYYAYSRTRMKAIK